MIIEQRKHTRLLPRDTIFAAIGEKYTKVGKVQDISLSGLAIEYIAGESDKNDPSRLDIFIAAPVFHIYNIPCAQIYDIEIHVPHVNNKYVKILTTKRCGVKFGRLDEYDLSQLELLLESYTNLTKIENSKT